MRDRLRSGSASAGGIPLENAGPRLATVVLLRATVAAMKCREHLSHARTGEAIAELGALHDALVELADLELGDAGAVERAKLVAQEQQLMLALRVHWQRHH